MKYLLLICLAGLVAAPASKPPAITFNVQKRVAGSGGDFKVMNEKQQWDPAKTAIIICDMWDEHWCKGATTRVTELAPHMNKVLNIAREKGMLIVHSPSDCMKYYAEYPQRKAAQQYSRPDDKYEEGRTLLLSEKDAVWPIDQSNGGCDDTPLCEERYPWTKEIALLDIKENDVITDSGPEMARMFKDREINRVILMGVHTNMCVIARPFGLRNMLNYGMNVALMRDLTDVMYDSRQAPFVNHFNGLGLMVEYIEKYIAPTVLSSDLTGEAPFRFKDDPRKN
jgi:nicotinamidase-related amidase